jgi:uncharacterized protein (UPF0305 family)
VTDQLMKFMIFIEKNAKVLRQKRRKSFLEKTLHVVMQLNMNMTETK